MASRSTGSCDFSGHLSGDDLRLPHGELEAFSAHQLDENSELQLATPLHLPRIGSLSWQHAQRDVPDELLLESRQNHAGGEAGAVLARERRRVDSDRHRETRLVHSDHGQRARIVGVGERLADRDLGDTGNCDQLTGSRLFGLDAVESFGHVQLGDLHTHDFPIGAAPGDLLTLANRPFTNAAEREAPEIWRRVEVRDMRLQRVPFIVERCRDAVDENVEERRKVVGEIVWIETRAARARVGVDDRKLDLALVGVEIEEELVHLVHHVLDPSVGSIDLVDDEDHRQPRLECLAEHEPRLRQRPFARVHEEQDAVHHRQRAFHLATEVGVARRVDDVDLDPVAPDGRVLRKNRDPFLAFEVHRVHHAIGDVLIGAERTGLPQHRVNERRLAVIDVGNDRNVPNILAKRHSRRVAAKAAATVGFGAIL